MRGARSALIAFMVAFGISVGVAALTTIRQVHTGTIVGLATDHAQLADRGTTWACVTPRRRHDQSRPERLSRKSRGQRAVISL